MWGRTASHTSRTWKNSPAQSKPADFPGPCAPAGEKLPPDMHFFTVLLSWMIFIHATQPQSDGNSLQTTCIKVVHIFFSTPALFAATSDTTEKYHTWQNIITQWLNMEGGVACLNSSVGAMSIWTLHRPTVHVLNLSTAGQKHVSYQVAAHY